jgi:hypothetical protein
MGTLGVAVSAGAIVAVAKQGIELASSLTEVQNVVDTTFGNSSKQIDAWSETALKSFGLSELQAKQFSSTLGAMMKSSGITGSSLVTMSENLAGLSGDFSSFYNVAQNDAFADLQSAMAGQTETMLKYGINMQVANLEAYALSKGIKTSYNNMDQASKTALRYAYIMDKSKDAQGDFTKTQGSFANQTRLLSTNWQQFIAKISSGALPALTDLAQKANDVISSITSNPGKMQAINDKIQSIIDKIGDLFDGAKNVYDFVKNNWSTIEPIIWGIVGAMTAYKTATLLLVGAQKAALIINAIVKAYQTAAIAMTWLREGESLLTVTQVLLNAAMTANPIGLIVVGITALIGVIVLLVRNWEKVTNAIKTAWEWLTKWNKTDAKEKLNSKESAKTYSSAFPSMVKYAGGGIANRASIFGEAGPEIAIPLKRTPRSLGLLRQATGILGASTNNGGVHIVYSPQITGANRSDVEDALQVNFVIFKAWLEQYFTDKGAESFA